MLAGANVGTAFEVGVQMAGVTRDIVFAGRMHAKWIKFDVRYLLGQDAAAQQQVIDETQANGFKVLLNVTGDPSSFRARIAPRMSPPMPLTSARCPPMVRTGSRSGAR